MAERDELVSARVPDDLLEQIEQRAEVEDRSRSSLVRLALEEKFESRDTEDPETSSKATRSVSVFSLLAAVNIGVAPSLVATGRVVPGTAAAVAAIVFGLLWFFGADTVTRAFVARFRDWVLDMMYDDRLVEEPETVVERLTYADVAGLAVLTVGIVLALPLALAAGLGMVTPVIEAIGAGGALVYAGVLVGVFYLGLGLVGVASIATLALATAGVVGEPVDDATDA